MGHETDDGKPGVVTASDCRRVGEVLALVGDKWSTNIIFALGNGVLRFNELKRMLGISQRMLSLTLRGLERDGLVLRRQFPTIPPKVEYELTPLGRAMRVPVMHLAGWAHENQPSIAAARALYDRTLGLAAE
jgi:DNA-binding HxlR family transcriptional regulator